VETSFGLFFGYGENKSSYAKENCSAIDMISDIGGIVVIIICDQGASNRALFPILVLIFEIR